MSDETAEARITTLETEIAALRARLEEAGKVNAAKATDDATFEGNNIVNTGPSDARRFLEEAK